jgi:hypothetical protein
MSLHQQHQQKKYKNYALGGTILFLAIIFFIAGWIKFQH